MLLETVHPDVFAVELEVVEVSAVALVVAPLAPLVALQKVSIPYHHLNFRACKFCTWKTGP